MSISDQKLAKLAKLKQLLEITTESLTREEFLDSFKKVIDHVFKVETKLIEKIDNKTKEEKEKLETLELEFGQIIEQAKKDSDSTFAGFKRRTIEAINQLFSRNEVNKRLNERLGVADIKISEIDQKLAQVKNGLDGRDGERGEPGKDADERKIIEEVLKKIEIPKKELDIESVKGLKKELEDLRNIRTRVGGGGTSAIGVAQAFKWIAHTEEPVGAINGTNKIYTVKNTIWWIAGFTLNGEQIAELPNFTYSGKTITFTAAIPSAYSGKDWEVKYIGT